MTHVNEYTLEQRKTHIDSINAFAWRIRMQDLQRCSMLANEAFNMAESQHYLRGMAESQTVMGFVCLRNGEFDAAITASTEAANLFELMQPEDVRILEPYVFGHIAESYLALNDFEEALTFLTRQLSLAEHLEDPLAQTNALRNLARIYAEMGDHEAALHYLQDALQLVHPDQAADIYNQIAEQALAVGQIERARQYAMTGLQRLKSVPQSRNMLQHVLLHVTLSDIGLSQGDFAAAREHLQLAWDASWRTSRANTISTLLMQFGKLQVIEGNIEAAINDYQRALAFARSNDDQQRQYQCHEALASLYEEMGDFARALYHHKTYAHLRRNSMNDQLTLRVQHTEMLMRTRIAQQQAQFYEERSRELEELRERDREYFEEINNLKDDMMSTATHDLKNPLATVITACYLLRQTLPEDAPQTSLVGRIEDQVDRMKMLIADLLDLAKLETGRAVNPQRSPIREVVLSAIDDMQTLAAARHIELEHEIPPLEAFIDPPKIRQVMDNLLSNAVKYTPDGGRVAVRAERQNGHVWIEVCDTGYGISTDDLPHVFDRFYRVDAPEHQAREGTGLGLAIVKSIIEQHGGDISVNSVVGSGSIFRFTLRH